MPPQYPEPIIDSDNILRTVTLLTENDRYVIEKTPDFYLAECYLTPDDPNTVLTLCGVSLWSATHELWARGKLLDVLICSYYLARQRDVLETPTTDVVYNEDTPPRVDMLNDSGKILKPIRKPNIHDPCYQLFRRRTAFQAVCVSLFEELRATFKTVQVKPIRDFLDDVFLTAGYASLYTGCGFATDFENIAQMEDTAILMAHQCYLEGRKALPSLKHSTEN